MEEEGEERRVVRRREGVWRRRMGGREWEEGEERKTGWW